jgi:hypothetical protein
MFQNKQNVLEKACSFVMGPDPPSIPAHQNSPWIQAEFAGKSNDFAVPTTPGKFYFQAIAILSDNSPIIDRWFSTSGAKSLDFSNAKLHP